MSIFHQMQKTWTIARSNTNCYLCCTTPQMLTKLNRIDKNPSLILFFFLLLTKYSQRASTPNAYFIHKIILYTIRLRKSTYCIRHIFRESNFSRIRTSRHFCEWLNSRSKRAMNGEVSIKLELSCALHVQCVCKLHSCVGIRGKYFFARC